MRGGSIRLIHSAIKYNYFALETTAFLMSSNNVKRVFNHLSLTRLPCSTPLILHTAATRQTKHSEAFDSSITEAGHAVVCPAREVDGEVVASGLETRQMDMGNNRTRCYQNPPVSHCSARTGSDRQQDVKSSKIIAPIANKMNVLNEKTAGNIMRQSPMTTVKQKLGYFKTAETSLTKET